MHLDLLVLKITDVLTEGALVWAMLSLKQISLHFKIPQRDDFVILFVCFSQCHKGADIIRGVTLGCTGLALWHRNPQAF